ncbi:MULTISPECIES: 1-deoxy-D-xylulose-5-phosphate reductoisomerase [unclassified Arthrobacter]|uniref:1-deoxy-D-xylulose-5-phosphate reductoisomerase n=1 Tax=unclassified Arthrobacter TaxID=235627 RepID=UPI001D139ED6|nr:MULTISPECIES: 1-deoxy-D-xylulose-5-phosphate reductoisomerase [unclassified Arthrobacter]MCC3277061.1 1-deoxy-D-xylulose-5-phosphate reductoisomerase [Arthrobacter sp. zg-Y20]MCC9178867.1 1-deoxy-D-xylulose-5-phosphate reductoisomerase [Arthrobacter sp. zg-Y750]MDK1317222.1 1-deoxy-D-xylulose-5-phosphate reductoisomerase [Arthrobacter sp. zg.Y20]WIB07792.1 1-deoxy-D-xylulose-5-phosphate reductoisomerase [Arthrobacter sp. zg-Y20]
MSSDHDYVRSRRPGSNHLPRRVVLLGSTGSIGTQAIDVADGAPERFRIVALAAGGSNLDLLAQQAVHTRAEAVGCAAVDVATLRRHIDAAAASAGVTGYDPELFAGPTAATAVAAWPEADVVLNGITGSIGLEPTLAALAAGHMLALANKESLIVGGELVKRAAAPGQLVPVDSEHSALAQALRSGTHEEVDRLVVTASGGPFRGLKRADLADVTPEQALAHPTWKMGRMVTTNSATMVNKALEVIEAHLLFDIPLERIDVVVHPQSVVHSMVQFVDGSTIAQASPPDMRLPIALGMGWPHRVPGAARPCDWTRATEWTFEPLDEEAFPAVALAKRAAAAGGTKMAVYNAANEEAVDAFHDGLIGFTDIVDTIAAVLGEAPDDGPLTLDSLLAAERWAREAARKRCGR